MIWLQWRYRWGGTNNWNSVLVGKVESSYRDNLVSLERLQPGSHLAHDPFIPNSSSIVLQFTYLGVWARSGKIGSKIYSKKYGIGLFSDQTPWK